MAKLKQWKRDHEIETDDKPFQWVDRSRPAGSRAHTRIWIERNVWGFDTKKWTVRKEQIDDSRRGQHKPTNLTTHSSKKEARKAAVEWMRNH